MYHRIVVGESAWLHDIGHGGEEHPAINQFRDVDGVFATTQELEDFVIANDRPGLEGHGLEQRLYGVLDSIVDVSFPSGVVGKKRLNLAACFRIIAAGGVEKTRPLFRRQFHGFQKEILNVSQSALMTVGQRPLRKPPLFP